MLIRCPECQFERTINTAQIPSTATVATCPKCGGRFRFREPGQTEQTPDPQAAHASTSPQPDRQDDAPHEQAANPEAFAAGAEKPVTPRLPTEQEGDDPLPPGAVIPHLEPPADPLANSSEKMTVRPEKGTARGEGTPENDLPTLAPDPTEAQANLFHNLLAKVRKSAGKASGDADEAKEQAAFADVPWEHPEKYGFFGSLYHTVVRVLFRAPEFFSNIHSNAPLTRPAVFFVLLIFFEQLLNSLWFLVQMRTISATATNPQVQARAGELAQIMTMPLLFLLVPFIALFLLFIQAGLYHLAIRLAQPDKADFSTTVRVIAYCAAPCVFSVVPFVGAGVSAAWFTVVSFIGCKYALRLSWVKTALALVPLFLLGIAFTIQFAGAFLSGF